MPKNPETSSQDSAESPTGFDAIHVNAGVEMGIIETCALEKISPNILDATEEQRAQILMRADEKWASEALEIDQPLSPEEKETLLSKIADPNLAYEVLTMDDANGKKLNEKQAESLMELIKTDEEAVYVFYMQIVESGIATEGEKNVAWWLQQLEETLAKTENPEIAAYVLENAAKLSRGDKSRLKKVIENNS